MQSNTKQQMVGSKVELVLIDEFAKMPVDQIERTNFSTAIDQLKLEVKREEARIYNVPRYYRPTLGMYKKLLNMLKGSLAIHQINQESADMVINGLSHQLETVRNNYDKTITKNKILFQLGKLVILK